MRWMGGGKIRPWAMTEPFTDFQLRALDLISPLVSMPDALSVPEAATGAT